jgi:hypothetical protein
VVPGAQAQLDWREEGDHSHDPFTCFATSMDLAMVGLARPCIGADWRVEPARPKLRARACNSSDGPSRCSQRQLGADLVCRRYSMLAG